MMLILKHLDFGQKDEERRQTITFHLMMEGMIIQSFIVGYDDFLCPV